MSTMYDIAGTTHSSFRIGKITVFSGNNEPFEDMGHVGDIYVQTSVTVRDPVTDQDVTTPVGKLFTKTFVDNKEKWIYIKDATSADISVDNDTIIQLTNKQIQAIGVKEKNKDLTIYDWVGTLQEWEDQQVETQHPTWICFITDDEQPGISVYTKRETDRLLLLKADKTYVDNLVGDIAQQISEI